MSSGDSPTGLPTDYKVVRFRNYEPRDFPRLCELDQMCFSEQIAYSPEEIAAALFDPRNFAIVAVDGEHRAAAGSPVIGFALASQDRASRGHIITIDIQPGHRRKGIGGELIERCEQRLAALGARRVVLEVAQDNAAAIAFYRSRGYVRQRTLPHYYPDGTDAYSMSKVL